MQVEHPAELTAPIPKAAAAVRQKSALPAEISNGDKRFLPSLQPALNFPCIVRKERQADRERGERERYGYPVTRDSGHFLK